MGIGAQRSSWKLICIQWCLGLGAHLFFSLPYLRRAHGLKRLDSSRRYLFVANHVSLLDTILWGSLCWRSGCYPLLTLGDKRAWRASKLRTLLSSQVGFLLDREKSNPKRLEELHCFGRAGGDFHLLVFPEGTRGDGVTLSPLRPGVFVIAQAARLPIVPVFIENMQMVSTKAGGFRPLAGLRKVEVHVGEAIAPEHYLRLSRPDFLEFLRQAIVAARQTPRA